MTEYQNTEKQQEEAIDIKAILFKYSHYWYYFIISILFCFFIAFLYCRYSKPIYSVSSTLLIRDDDNSQLGAENLLEGLEIFSGKTNLKNEIALLNSYTITKQAIEDLGFGISYFKHGKIITSVLYENLPFKVTIDSLHPQIVGEDFQITVLSDTEYKLKVNIDDEYAYNIITEKFEKSILVDINLEEIYKFGQVVETDGFSFVLNKNDNYFNPLSSFDEYKFSFTFHSIATLIGKYVKLTTINPINKDASVLKLNIRGNSPRKNIDFLNKLTDVYIKNGLDEKNKMATNTIEFIEKQLINVSDSLHLIESSLEKFKSENPKLAVTYKEFGAFYQIQKLYNDLSVIETHHKYYESLLTYVEENENNEKIVAPSSMGINDPLLNNLIGRLSELYAEQEELRLTSQQKNPRLISIESQIRNLKSNLIENIKNIIASPQQHAVITYPWTIYCR